MFNKFLYKLSFFILIGYVLSNDQGERIEFMSSSPFSFYHIITNLENEIDQEVYGTLRFPDNLKQDNLPMVLGINGSKNWASHHLEYLGMFREMGYATFELHSFNSRNVESTVGSQTQVTTAMMILDAYRALDKLSYDPRINTDNVAMIGWSLGGGAVLFSAWKPIMDAISPNLKFKAHLSFYPPCLVDLDLMSFSSSPIHILIGELDNWVSSEACEDLVYELTEEGVNINIDIYEGSHHGFDREGPLDIEKNGYKTGECHFNMRSDGALLMNFFNIPMTTPLRQKIALAMCAKRGPTIGGNPKARENSFKFAKNFMEKHLIIR
jgi:dienelactone hydrolase